MCWWQQAVCAKKKEANVIVCIQAQNDSFLITVEGLIDARTLEKCCALVVCPEVQQT